MDRRRRRQAEAEDMSIGRAAALVPAGLKLIGFAGRHHRHPVLGSTGAYEVAYWKPYDTVAGLVPGRAAGAKGPRKTKVAWRFDECVGNGPSPARHPHGAWSARRGDAPFLLSQTGCS